MLSSTILTAYCNINAGVMRHYPVLFLSWLSRYVAITPIIFLNNFLRPILVPLISIDLTPINTNKHLKKHRVGSRSKFWGVSAYEQEIR